MSFIKNISHTFFTKVLGIALGIISSAIVARWLGPELNGKAVLLLSAPMFLFMLGNFGYGSALSFYTARNEYDRTDIINISFLSAMLFSSIMIVLFFLTYKLHESIWNDIEFSYVLFAVFLTPFYFIGNYLTRIIVGCQKIILSNNISILIRIIKILLIVILVVIFKNGVIGILEVNAVEIVILFLCNIWILRKYIKIASINIKLLKSTFQYGIKIYFALLISFLNLRLDIYLVKYFTADNELVGYYSIAVAIAEMVWVLPDSIVTVLFPSVAAGEKDKNINKTILSLKWNMFIMLIGGLGITLLAKPAIVLVYGNEYLPSFMPLVCLVPGIILYPITKILGVDMAARGYPGYITIITFVGLMINFIANIILIPKYSINGAAIASSISYSFTAILSLLFFKHVLKKEWKDFIISH
ncbi:MAG: oligosaccharide flippase family protein [Bacteroidales bacterium]|nr:oligosaccharide flippase family protein [Bacteroidales bacterium]